MSNITVFEFDSQVIREQDSLFSIYDIISVIGGQKNAAEVWKRLVDKGLIDEVVKCEFISFTQASGRKGRKTPVCTRDVALEIIGLLPGTVGKKYRQEAAKLFGRYIDADITLADDIIQRQTDPKKLEWQAKRIQGKKVRLEETNTLQAHGVTEPMEFAQCTNSIYKPVLGGTAKEVRESKALTPKQALRDNLTTVELAAVMLAEALATAKIETNNLQGFKPCNQACKDAGDKVKLALA